MDLEEFLKRKKPQKRKSKLFNFRDEILILKKEGFTFKDIQEFLELNGIKSSINNIYFFYKRELAKEKDKDIENDFAGEKEKRNLTKKKITKEKKDNEPDLSFLPKNLQEKVKNYNNGELKKNQKIRDQIRENSKKLEKYF